MTPHFQPLARSTTMLADIAAPDQASTLPVISTPMSGSFAIAGWVEALAAGSSRASRHISEMACSPVVDGIANGVFIHNHAAAVAAGYRHCRRRLPARPRLSDSSPPSAIGGHALVANGWRDTVILIHVLSGPPWSGRFHVGIDGRAHGRWRRRRETVVAIDFGMGGSLDQ